MNILILAYLPFFMIMTLFISLFVPTLLSKMELPSIRCINIWRSSVLSPFIRMFLSPIVVIHFSLRITLWTTCLSLFLVVKSLIGSCSLIALSTVYPLRVFGCTSYICALDPDCDKLDPRAIMCVFLEYSRPQKGYKCYSPSLHQHCLCWCHL